MCMKYLNVTNVCLQYKRQSTDGLSILMFWLAILGNLTYGLAILVRQLDSVYVIRHVPWLVGSLGVIFLDASVSFQTNLIISMFRPSSKDPYDKCFVCLIELLKTFQTDVFYLIQW